VAGKIAKEKANPTLAVIIAEGNHASEIYVTRKQEACRKVGINSIRFDVPKTVTQKELLTLVGNLNADPKITGILIQLPLPPQIDEKTVLWSLDPAKDVDGFHPQNLGKLLAGTYDDSSLFSCTPKGVMKLLDEIGCGVRGKVCVVVGTSNIVGKPLVAMLVNREATVVTCNRHTPDLAAMTRQADILVVAVGKPMLITASMVKEGAVVIDVGINRLADGKLAGDVDFQNVLGKVSRITPVPGGVGPVTVAVLMENTLLAYEYQHQKKSDSSHA
jgi:methylenetetrahydrofolate dehydrogenase (NADP+)/methenyltetrahydrofolate cyclohydrolase